MANWTILKAAIADAIKANGTNAITGDLLQSTLISIVSNIGENATFKGIATPTTVPGIPDGPVFYLANKPGIYTNFSAIEIGNGLSLITKENDSWVSYNLLPIEQSRSQNPNTSPSSKLMDDVITNIIEQIKTTTTSSESDFQISDENGNIILELLDGHVISKNFNSSKAPISVDGYTSSDLDFTDENGNIILKLLDGHIETKFFSSIKSDRLNSKKIYLYGDSITWGYRLGSQVSTYSNLLKEKLHTENISCVGYSGAALSGTASNNLQTLSRLQDIISYVPDLVIIMAGTNDYGQLNGSVLGFPMGDVSGDISNSSYLLTSCGGLRYILDYLKKNLPKTSNILFCTQPPYAYNNHNDQYVNSDGHTSYDYVSSFKHICNELHVPICDIYSNANWYSDNELISKIFTSDGVHLSDLGYDRITNLQVESIKQLIF